MSLDGMVNDGEKFVKRNVVEKGELVGDNRGRIGVLEF